jgi:hypothetical protein
MIMTLQVFQQPDAPIEFRNASKKEFQSLDSEQSRTYKFPDGEVTIENPLWINVGPGGHRIFDAQGVSHYVPKGWFHLSWTVKDGKPHFDF